jgi:DNA-binding transcriptional regulator YiaG
MQLLNSAIQQNRVAFLPFVSICLTARIPKPYPENPTTLGEHLRKRRNELGLFQKEVAKHLGVSQWTLIGWETGRQVRGFARHEAAVIRFLGYNPLPPPATLGEAIRRKRRELGLTARQLAAWFGWDEGTVRRYEKDTWIPQGERRERVERFRPAPRVRAGFSYPSAAEEDAEHKALRGRLWTNSGLTLEPSVARHLSRKDDNPT